MNEILYCTRYCSITTTYKRELEVSFNLKKHSSLVCNILLSQLITPFLELKTGYKLEIKKFESCKNLQTLNSHVCIDCPNNVVLTDV